MLEKRVLGLKVRVITRASIELCTRRSAMSSNLPAANLSSPFNATSSAAAPTTPLEAWNMPIFGDFSLPKAAPAPVVEPAKNANSSPETPVAWNQPAAFETTEPLDAPAPEAPVLEAPAFEAPVLEAPAFEAPAFEAPVLEVTAREELASSAPAKNVPVVTNERTPEEMLQQVLDQLASPESYATTRGAHVEALAHPETARQAPAHQAPVARQASIEQAPTPEARFVRGETSEIWGVKLDRVRMDEAVESIEAMIADRVPRYIITANLNYAMLLAHDPSLQVVTDQASMILADGQPFVWRSRIGSAGRLPERVAGSELIYRIAERAAQHGWRIYFLGAEPGVAQRCADTLVKRYPKLQIAGVQSPPYRKQSEAEQQAQQDAIISSQADILLVAFGQPKGERWIHQHYEKLGVPVSIQVGATFDFVAGTAKRAPKLWQQFGLEWAYRMMSDPGRLVPRYMSNAWFLSLAMICDWRDLVNAKFGPEAEFPNRHSI